MKYIRHFFPLLVGHSTSQDQCVKEQSEGWAVSIQIMACEGATETHENRCLCTWSSELVSTVLRA